MDEIEAAWVRVRPAARVTPLIEVAWPANPSPGTGSSRATPGEFFLKCENFQPMGAFKIRGAYNMLAQLSPEALERGVITYSSGNHGQAVALAAGLLGAAAVIVMPTTAPNVKVEGARGFGAEVTFAGTTSLERKARAEEIARERGLTMVPPFDHPMIIAGQGTVGLEILDQCPGVATVVVEVGGGGLSSGVAAAVKQRRSEVRVVGVEPEGAAKMSRSLEAGHPVTLDRVASIADGLMTVRPGDLTFEHVRTFVDEVVTVSDAEMVRAIQWLYRHARLVVEPSGSVTTAAVMLGLGGIDPARGAVVAIVSGGNVEAAKYAEYITA
ncbi:MAG TPA: threonine/serine dehydratase [Vicinamibacterales bacterium]|nr:threonine/serine dehydratase [Vicinamibacterales bacterium]